MIHIIDVVSSLIAQGAATPSNDAIASPGPNAATVTSVWDFVVKGGIVMIPIGACSLVALTLAVERMVSLRRSRVIPEGFVRGLLDVLGQGGSARAADYCRSNPSPMARVCEAGLRRWDSPLDHVEKLMAEAGLRELTLLRKYLRGLSVIGSVAPLLGLLGTIFGMIKAFQTVAQSAEALGRTELLAGGIYEAMITTAAGLIVAIPSLLLYHLISAKIDRLIGEIDSACQSLLERHASNIVRSTTAAVAPHTGSTRSEGLADDGTSVRASVKVNGELAEVGT